MMNVTTRMSMIDRISQTRSNNHPRLDMASTARFGGPGKFGGGKNEDLNEHCHVNLGESQHAHANQRR
jgi:hypothetical protein